MSLYRLARPAPRAWNVGKTAFGLAGFSLLAFVALPRVTARLRATGALDALFIPRAPVIGIVLAAAGSAIVIWSAVALAVLGCGTPMPWDAPRRLVIGGPYAWLRNPMVVGTVLQGFGVGVARGSIPLMLVFAMAALFWNVVVRPRDEDQLQRSFGRDYELYRRSVRCWMPHRRRWSPPPRTGPISLEELPERRRERYHRHVADPGIWGERFVPPATDVGAEDA